MKKKIIIAVIILVVVLTAGILFWAYKTGRIGSSASTTGEFYVDVGMRKIVNGMPTEKVDGAIYIETSGKNFSVTTCATNTNDKNPTGGGFAAQISRNDNFRRLRIVINPQVSSYYVRVNYNNDTKSCVFSLYGVSNGTADPTFGGHVLKVSNPTPGMVATAVFATTYSPGGGTVTPPPPAPSGTINGRVVTIVNGQKVGIDGATVQVRGVTGKSATTFGGGYYWIYGLNRGTYTLDAGKTCEYNTSSTSVTVEVNKIKTAPDISLVRGGIPADKAKIEGYVKDISTGRVVPGAQVWYRRSNIVNDPLIKGGAADGSGYYSICPLVTYPFKYAVKAWAAGYVWTDETIVTGLVNGQAKQLDFNLRK